MGSVLLPAGVVTVIFPLSGMFPLSNEKKRYSPSRFPVTVNRPGQWPEQIGQPGWEEWRLSPLADIVPYRSGRPVGSILRVAVHWP